MAATSPHVELLAWSECPSHPRALELLGTALHDLGHDELSVTVIWVETDEEAQRERFVGSPSIRVDGRDLFPAGPDEPFALACRIYLLPDGRVSPVPDREQMRTALASALAEG